MTWTAKVQERLGLLGFDVGPVDGILGPRTRAAIHACQEWHQEVAGSDDVDDVLWPDVLTVNRDEDPHEPVPEQVNPVWPRQKAVRSVFGEPGKHLTLLELPFPMILSWDLSTTIKRFSVHQKVHDSAKRCFERIADAYDADERRDLGIDIFGGCYSHRPMRGGTRLSMHAYAIAIDFDPVRNPLHGDVKKARLMQPDAEPFWQIWESEGWVSLGRVAGLDPMHIQAVRL